MTKARATAIKNTIYVEANVMKISTKFQTGCFKVTSRMWDLIVSVPDHCLSFYFSASSPWWLLRRRFVSIFCENLAFWLPWQPISDLDKIHMFGRGLLKELIVFFKNVCQNICNEIEIKAYFHFAYYKSVETISYHSDESTWATK